MARVDYKAEWCRYTLDFNFEARTSRGAMRHKDTYFIRITTPDGRCGIGEVPLFRGLSQEDTPDFENILADRCRDVTSAEPAPSSIAFGIHSAFDNMPHTDMPEREPSDWERGLRGIPVNGLVWMGDKRLMQTRISQKLDQGFRVIKIKIGGIDFDDELDLIAGLRQCFSRADLEIRLDANGAFTPENALERLQRLAPFGIHSLEQPIRAGQTEAMAAICDKSPIPVALDEELIGTRSIEEKAQLIDDIKPAYLVLKPSLCGGFADAEQYMRLIGPGRWWVTSALESNVGLYAIAKWLSRFETDMAQGLGTGLLYTNNIAAPLAMEGNRLWCKPDRPWQDLSSLPWHQ